MRVQVVGEQNGSAGPDFDDADRAQAEVEVPEMLQRKAEQGAGHDFEDTTVSDDERPAPLGANVAVAKNLVAVHRAGGCPDGHLGEHSGQGWLYACLNFSEVLAALGVVLQGPAPPTAQRVAELRRDLFLGKALPPALGDLGEAGVDVEWGSGAARGGHLLDGELGAAPCPSQRGVDDGEW